MTHCNDIQQLGHHQKWLIRAQRNLAVLVLLPLLQLVSFTGISTPSPRVEPIHGSGHEDAAALLSGFAIN